MKTHIIENGVVVNTIAATVEEAKYAYPEAVCIPADKGGIGWAYANGQLVAPRKDFDLDVVNAPILAELKAIDARTIRPLREGDLVRVAALEAEAEALRSQLVKV